MIDWNNKASRQIRVSDMHGKRRGRWRESLRLRDTAHTGWPDDRSRRGSCPNNASRPYMSVNNGLFLPGVVVHEKPLEEVGGLSSREPDHAAKEGCERATESRIGGEMD